MPLPVIPFECTGRVNRRDLVDELKPGDVLCRENFYVIGAGEKRVNKKMPGSKRHSASDVGGRYTTAFRYYTSNARHTFAYNLSGTNGSIYHIDENGNETKELDVPAPGGNAYPTWMEMRVSSADVLYFSDGVNGMYSYDGNAGHDFIKETSVSLNFVQLISHLDRAFGFEEDSEIRKSLMGKFYNMGAPLNDNVLQFNKDQQKWCFGVVALVEQLNGM